MSARYTKWVVTAAAQRITLNAQRAGESTFTVTNPGGVADRAVLDPVAGEGADESWLVVDEPLRLVRAGASVSSLLRGAGPAGTPPGEYAVQGRVYSAESAPEESSVLSPRVMLEVPAEPEPDQPERSRWWWLVAAGLAVVLLVVGGVLVFDRGDGRAVLAPTPSPAASPGTGELVMPDLVGMSEREALQTLADFGLTVRPIKYRHDPEQPDQVVRQSIVADQVVSTDAVVDLEVAVELAAPEVTAPTGVPVRTDHTFPTFEWQAGQSVVRRWRVTWQMETCVINVTVGGVLTLASIDTRVTGCSFSEPGPSRLVDTTSYQPSMAFSRTRSGMTWTYQTGWIRWQVAAVDDFGVAGPGSEFRYFRLAVT
jgi:hypothetical protein